VNEIYGEALLRQLADLAERPGWLSLWTAISFLGSATFFTLLVPALFALATQAFALRCTARVMISAWVTELLKWLVGRPRLDPLQLGATRPLEHAGLFENDSLPSGHALMAVVVWIGLARERASPARLAAASALVLLIAFSRLALLRHDLLDVVAGLLAGALLSATIEWLRRRLQAWRELPWIELAGLWAIASVLAQRAVPTDGAAVVSGVLAGVGFGAAARRNAAQRAPLTPGALWILLANWIVVAALGWAAERMAVGQPLLLFGLYAAAGLWIAAVTPSFRRAG
jgi:membrane-associated phospholipid phosphatase